MSSIKEDNQDWTNSTTGQRGQDPGRPGRPGRGQPGDSQETPRRHPGTRMLDAAPSAQGCIVPEDRLRHRCPPEVSLKFRCTHGQLPARENSLKTHEISSAAETSLRHSRKPRFPGTRHVPSFRLPLPWKSRLGPRLGIRVVGSRKSPIRRADRLLVDWIF